MSARTRTFVICMLVNLYVFTLYHAYYIESIMVNVPWQTWFEQTNRLERAFEHTLTIGDLFTQFGEHGMFGYNCLAVFNAKYFSLNTFFDSYIYLGASVVCAVFLLWRARENLNLTARACWVVSALLCALWFTVTQKTSGGMDTQVRLSVCFVVINAALLDKILSTGERPRLSLLILFGVGLVFSLVVFGTMYSFGWMSAAFAALAFRLVQARSLKRSEVWLSLGLIAGCVTYLLVYPLPTFTRVNDTPFSLSASAWQRILHPIDSLSFLSAFLGSGTLAHSYWMLPPSPGSEWHLYNGVVVLLIYVTAFVLFFTCGIYKRSWLPLFLIMHTVGVGLLLLLGRFGMFGLLGGTYEWYSIHHKVGLVGVFLVYCHVFMQEAAGARQRRFIQGLGIASVCYMAPLLLISEAAEWRRSMHIQPYYGSMLAFAQKPSARQCINSSQTPLVASFLTTVESINFYRKYQLGFCKGQTLEPFGRCAMALGACADETPLKSGWYCRDGDGRWIAKTATLEFQSGPEGLFFITGHVHEFRNGTILVVTPAKGEPQRFTLSSGLFEVWVNVRPNELITMQLECSQSAEISPAAPDVKGPAFGLFIRNIYSF